MLNSHSLRGITDGGENRRYRYLSVSARKKTLHHIVFHTCIHLNKSAIILTANLTYWDTKMKLQGKEKIVSIILDRIRRCTIKETIHTYMHVCMYVYLYLYILGSLQERGDPNLGPYPPKG